MSGDAVIGCVALLFMSVASGFAGGLLMSADFWAHRTKCREMQHAERMAELAHRTRLMEFP